MVHLKSILHQILQIVKNNPVHIRSSPYVTPRVHRICAVHFLSPTSFVFAHFCAQREILYLWPITNSLYPIAGNLIIPIL